MDIGATGSLCRSYSNKTVVLLGNQEEWCWRGNKRGYTIGFVPWPHFTDEELSSGKGGVRARSADS